MTESRTRSSRYRIMRRTYASCEVGRLIRTVEVARSDWPQWKAD
jgi:hypothetical protein